jgi:hypothetical protein
MRHIVGICILLMSFGTMAEAHTAPLWPETDMAAFLNELSGEFAKEIWSASRGFTGGRGS